MGQGLGEEGQPLPRGTLGEKNCGGRTGHLNMKLITCKYNANDMQTSKDSLGPQLRHSLFWIENWGQFASGCMSNALFLYY